MKEKCEFCGSTDLEEETVCAFCDTPIENKSIVVNKHNWEGFFYCPNCEMPEVDTVQKLVCQVCGKPHDYDWIYEK